MVAATSTAKLTRVSNQNDSTTPPTRPPLVVTIGGGGSYAFGFALGIARGLREEGIDIASVPLVGTSGGAHAAVAIAAGLSFDDVEPIWTNFVNSSGSLWIKSGPLAEQLYGHVVVSDVAGVAVRPLRFRRELLRAPEVRPADLVAASSSPFPFARPHKVDKRRYIDGGHRSFASADLAGDADLQLVLAAFADRRQGFLGKMGGRQALKETQRWRHRTAGETVVIGPNDAMCAVVAKGMRALGDMGIGRSIYDLAVPIGRDYAATLRRDHPTVLARIVSTR